MSEQYEDRLRTALETISRASNPPEGGAWYRAVARAALSPEQGAGAGVPQATENAKLVAGVRAAMAKVDSAEKATRKMHAMQFVADTLKDVKECIARETGVSP